MRDWLGEEIGIKIKKGSKKSKAGHITNEDANKTIEEAAKKWKELALSNEMISFGIGLMSIESGFNYLAETEVSNSHAKGLGQFQPGTWSDNVIFFNKKYNLNIDSKNNLSEKSIQIIVLGYFIKDKLFPKADIAIKGEAKEKGFTGKNKVDVAYAIHHGGSACAAALSFMNGDYIKCKLKETIQDNYKRALKELEKEKKEEIKVPQNFQEALKTMFPPLKIAKDRLLSVSWVGYKFTNLYQLTQEECKKEEADIVKIAKNKFKEEKTNLNLIKRGEIYQTLIKAGTYEGTIAKDDKDKEINYFYNKEEEARVLGSVKLAYAHSCHGLNFINPTVYSPINGKIHGTDERNIIVEETHKSQEEVKYLHYFKNVFSDKLSVGKEIKVGDVLGQIEQASKDFDDINLTYSINKIDVKASDESIRIAPLEFWTTGKHKGVSFESINEGLKSIVLGKFGEMKENDNGKKETHLIHSLNENEDRNMPILVDGYKIGHYVKKIKEFSYEEKEMIFNRKESKLENKGLNIGYEYVPSDKELFIRAGGKPKLTIKNFVNGNHGIYLEGLVTTGNQINLFVENNKEEQSDSESRSKKGSASGSGGEKYIGHGAKASCPLGGQITLKALSSAIYSDGKMLLDSSHKAPNVNICGSGTCSAVKPPRCNPIPIGSWLMTSPKFIIGGQAALTDKSMIGCALGGIIRINDTAQKSFGYGSAELNLLADKSKEDEKAIKNQQEGKEAEEKIITVVTILRKTKIEGYKKEVKVEELLLIQWNEFFKVNYENKEYKMVKGFVKKTLNTTLFSICGFANDKEDKALLSENSYEIVLDDKKVYKIGEFQIIDSSNKKGFYENNKNLTLGSSISVNNNALVVTEYNKALAELNKIMNIDGGEKGTVGKVKGKVETKKIDTNDSNIKSKLSREYPMEIDTKKWIIFEAGINNNIDPIFLRRLAAFARDSNKKISINGGYRSFETQEKIFIKNGGIKKDGRYIKPSKWNPTEVATPGNSWHEYGEAVDTSSDWLKSINKTEESINQLILIKYGLHKPITIGNFPKKSKFEDWHIEPYETINLRKANCSKEIKKEYLNAFNNQ